jgi:hypothetical protein
VVGGDRIGWRRDGGDRACVIQDASRSEGQVFGMKSNTNVKEERQRWPGWVGRTHLGLYRPFLRRVSPAVHGGLGFRWATRFEDRYLC